MRMFEVSLPAARTVTDPTGSAGLTFGQLAAWRDVSALAADRSHEANVFHTVRLPHPVPVERLAAAVSALDARHESLRTVYDLTDPLFPRQIVLPPRPVRHLPVVPEHEVDAARAELVGRPFELTADRQLRVLGIIRPGSTDLTGVVLCTHHLACDGWSLGLLVTELLALLAGAAEPGPPAQCTLAGLAAEQRSAPSWRRRSQASQRHFHAVRTAGCAELRTRPAAGEMLQAALESRALHDAAHAVAHEHAVSPATVLTAAFLATLSECCTDGPIRVELMSANRFAGRWQQLVTSMNQTVPVLMELHASRSLGGQLAPVQLATLRGYRVAMYDVDQVSAAALGLPTGAGESLCRINSVTGAEPRYLDESPVVHWENPFNLRPATCNLRIFQTTGGTVRLQVRTSALDRADTAALLLETWERVAAARS